MKNLRKMGGVAALYLAVAYLVGIVLFLVVLDYPSISDPAQKVVLLVEKQMVVYATNLLMYVFFGVFLIVLSLALYERLKSGAPAIMQVATAIGIIWAGSLIASGMVANAGIAPVVALYAKDPVQAALTWQGIESVANGLGNSNGEILGGLLALLVSLAALRVGGLPKGLNILGLLVGAAGIISLIPGLTGPMVGVFGLSQIIWFAWLGIALLRSNPSWAALAQQPLRLQVSTAHKSIGEADSIMDVTRVDSSPVGTPDRYVFRTTGTVVKLAGHTGVYLEGTDKELPSHKPKNEQEAEDESDRQLPTLREGESLHLVAQEAQTLPGLISKQHFTQPPPRYNEALLIRELEEKGIGRPSTYASIISTILDRKYVEKVERRFLPTETGRTVNDFLLKGFPDLLDTEFTSHMEEQLDEVEEGTKPWVSAVRDFYTPF